MMSVNSFKTILEKLETCNRLPIRVKDILNSTNDSINELNENDFNELWILLHEFLEETLVIEDITQDNDLATCYIFIIYLIHHVFNHLENITFVYKQEHLLNTILIFQNIYTKNINYELKLEVMNTCLNFWRQVSISQIKNRTFFNFDSKMTEHFKFTFNYLFDTIEITTTKSDMNSLSLYLKDFCKLLINLSNNENVLNLFVLKLENMMKNTLFLDTESGKLAIAEIFSSNQQLFLRFHQIIKKNLPKVNKLEANAYGDIYFISWIKSNESMREVIEQQGIFDFIFKTFILQRKGLAFRNYRNALILLQSIQSHRKHLIFSKVITKLYEPVLWKQLESKINMARCNAVEMLVRVYPLEKIGESRIISSRYLIKQQDSIIKLLKDICPQVRISAVKGICHCLRYFWDSFENDQINKCFTLLCKLANESVYEVRRVVFIGFNQIVEENKSHHYFMSPFFMTLMKNTWNDENEKVRHAFIQFLLKIKKVDNQSRNNNKIDYAKIVDLSDIACALAREEGQNTLLLIDLIFDNFIGEQVPNRHATLIQFYKFYQINPIAFQKLIINSDKRLNFENAYLLILSLLNTLNGILENIEEENRFKFKRCKTNDDSDNANYTTNYSAINLCINSNGIDDKRQNEQLYICCILDCVNCLMILHRDTFMNEINHIKKIEIEDLCSSCLVKIFDCYKDSDTFFNAMSLASLIPLPKLTAHVPIYNAALSALQQLPYDIKNPEEKIDMHKVNCLVYTLCMWKQGYEILQFVIIWFHKAFDTLNHNSTQYPGSKNSEGEEVSLGTKIEDCKPMTGIILINSMLISSQAQNSLMDCDVNKKTVYDLISCLQQRIELVIENRIHSNDVLNEVLSDEVLVELFRLYIRLHIIYYSDKKSANLDEIIKQQTSILNWIIINLSVHNLDSKNEATLIFATKTVDVVNNIVSDICSMGFVTKTYLDNFFKYCKTVLCSRVGSWNLTSMISTLIHVCKHLNYFRLIDDNIRDTSLLINCVCSIISIYSESNFNEESFKSVIGEPPNFLHNLTKLILLVYQINMVEFNNVLLLLIEKVVVLTTNHIKEVDGIDVNEKPLEMPYAAHLLAMVIFSDPLLRNYFSLNAISIFSSDIYKNDCARLLSVIICIHSFSSKLNPTESTEFEPIVKLLYKTLIEHEVTQPMCNMNRTQTNQDIPISETSTFDNECAGFKKRGRDILFAIAVKLHVSLS